MVSVADWDTAIRAAASHGFTGNIPLTGDTQFLISELHRRVSVLSELVFLLIRHTRQGPDWERNFKVSYEDINADNQVTILHEFGYTPDHFVVVRQRNARGAATAIANQGGLRIVGSDDVTMTFHLDDAAITDNRVFFVCPYRQAFVAPDFAGDPATALAFGSGSPEEPPVKGGIDFTLP